MILNFTDRYLFHTWLQLKSQNFEVVKKMKILGTIFTDRLSSRDGSHVENILWKCPWAVMCCVGGMITSTNKKDLERTQKNFCKLVLQENYKLYKNALYILCLKTLETRRKTLILKLAKTSIANGHFTRLILKKKTQKRNDKKSWILSSD